ncbi:MAG: Cys-tRNA(Pro) deacylase [Spirochaetales bacterium]|nr:Cys-tRNA(Pro) deacylase [Spirochaetales bacterium]
MKTNALRILEQKKIPHEAIEYPVDEDHLDAVSVAEKSGLEPCRVFKTLVTKGSKSGPAVFCIPGDQELNLKAAAKAAGEKKTEMLPLRELLPLTGYIHGGCSPLGMKKFLPFFLDESAFDFDRISISGGARGIQVLLSPNDILKLTRGRSGAFTDNS